MRRAVPVVVATAGALALLANFHTSAGGNVIAAGPAQAPTQPAGRPTPSGSTTPSTTSPAPGGPPATTTMGGTRTVDGPVVRTDYGDVQVRVTLQGKKIVDIAALKLPNDRARSQRISQQAAPLLRSETLQAQSANIDLLSGASYTSQGYTAVPARSARHGGTVTRRVELQWGTAITVDIRDECPVQTIDEVFAWFQRVDDLFSTWRTDSEISRLGRRELRLTEVSSEVRAVLELCDQVSEESCGAFDIRVGADPRVAPREGLGPIDPSGLVKGWALQRAGEQLRGSGVESFAINAGGDVITAGQPCPDTAWHVGLQHPWRRDKVAMVLAVSDVGVATSGRYERGDHIIDPSTGLPATGLQAVTVVHADLALADGYATAALVLGDRGAAWLAELGLAGVTIGEDETVTTTAALERLRLRD